MFPQQYFYPLYDDFDKNFFERLKTAAKEKYQFVGEDEEKRFFVKSLLCLQMLKDYRAPLRAVAENLAARTDCKTINNVVRAGGATIDYSWAVWTRDKEMGKRAETLWARDITLEGTDEEFNEFVVRYLVAVFLAGWEGPLYALLHATKDGYVRFGELNRILSLWDFTGA